MVGDDQHVSPDVVARLRDLGYDDAAIAELTPDIMTAILARSMRTTIARFSALKKPEVEEHIDTTWDEWLEHLTTEPTATTHRGLEHGGWSPVLYDPPMRSRDNVRRVFAIILDHDKGGDWTRIRDLWSGFYGALYTTKSHGAPNSEGDRVRVVLPLLYPVGPGEYADLWTWAMARSASVGLPPDPQCKDVSRFWFDAVVPPGGWRAERLAGLPLVPAKILAEIEQPKLRIVPPPSLTTDERLRRARAYLAKIPGAVSGNQGHTATFNAVAAMMFGFDLDTEDTRRLIVEDYNPRCDPPWSEREIEHKLASVSDRCTRERGYLLRDRPPIQTSQQAAAHAPPAPEIDLDWRSRLLLKRDMTPRREFANVLVFVEGHPTYRGRWSMDMRTETPWFAGAPMRPSMVSDIRAHAGAELGFTPAVSDVEAAIVRTAEARPFHPIRQYLRSLDWDGQPRLADMAHVYFGSPEVLHAEMVRKWMIAAASRVLWPGCKVDTALMLSGPQGIRKSTFFAVLGGEWHADTFVDIRSKDSFLQVHASWIYELAELENVLHDNANSQLKQWMTSTHDSFRAPYQKTVERRARSFVLCGTTNKRRFLSDDTGSRRFWIVPVARMIATELLEAQRDQLWAEAVATAEAGEHWWLDAASEHAREAANREHEEQDSWLGPITRWLEGRDTVTMTDLLSEALKLEIGRHDRAAQTRAGRVMTRLGWSRARRRASGDREYHYERPHCDVGTALPDPTEWGQEQPCNLNQ